MRHIRTTAIAAGLAVALSTGSVLAGDQDTFTYQGQLREAGAAYNGAVDVTFRLFGSLAGNDQIGGDLNMLGITVTDGLLMADLDFGVGMFDGNPRWLEIVVDGTTMSPRQPLLPAPYAMFALDGNQGPQGEQGDPGPQGEQGIQGEQGVQGIQGAQGEPGPPGADGQDGADGAPGQDGADGQDGAQGPPGDSHWQILGTTTYYNDGFVGVGRSDTVTSSEVFGIYRNTTSFGGMYAETLAGGEPFYGYSTDGVVNAYHYYDGDTDDWRLWFGADRFVIENNGNIGIGTTAAQSKLDVYTTADGGFEQGGAANFEMNNTAAINPTVFITGNSLNTGFEPLQVVNHGRGGAAVFEAADVAGAGFGAAGVSRGNGVAMQGDARGSGTNAVGVWGLASSGSSSLPLRATQNGAGPHIAKFQSQGVDETLIHADGGISINSTSGAYMLDVREESTSANAIHFERYGDAVANADLLELEIGGNSADDTQFIECQRDNGDIEFRVWGDGDVSADGVFTAGGADYAEMIKVSTGADSVEPGDVLMIDINNPRAVVLAEGASSTLVAGIYSTQPGVLGSEHDWDQLEKELLDMGANGETGMDAIELAKMLDEVPLAVVGIVPCKVSAENGPIQPGDLLVTSRIPGHAMKHDNPRAGSIIGKSLGSLDFGTGTIKVLVTLQ